MQINLRVIKAENNFPSGKVIFLGDWFNEIGRKVGVIGYKTNFPIFAYDLRLGFNNHPRPIQESFKRRSPHWDLAFYDYNEMDKGFDSDKYKRKCLQLGLSDHEIISVSGVNIAHTLPAERGDHILPTNYFYDICSFYRGLIDAMFSRGHLDRVKAYRAEIAFFSRRVNDSDVLLSREGPSFLQAKLDCAFLGLVRELTS